MSSLLDFREMLSLAQIPVAELAFVTLYEIFVMKAQVMADSNFRPRVEALLSGDLSHLDRLLLFVRDKCDGRNTVREIGDMIAHPNRNKGVLKEAAAKSFSVLRFHGEYSKKSLDYKDLPDNFLEIIEIKCSQVNSQEIKMALGINKKIFSDTIKKIKMKFSSYKNKRIYINSGVTQREYDVMNYIARTLHIQPAFNSDLFIKEFIEVLKSNELLKKGEINDLKLHSNGIILSVMACIHNCDFNLDDKTVASARIRIDPTGSLIVMVTADVTYGGLQLFCCIPLFSSNLRPEENCDQALLMQSHPWDFPVYVDTRHKLRRLQGNI